MALRLVWPTIATTGTWSSLASYRPLSRWMAPGPEVAMQTPTRPVNLAYPTASKAAISSCLAWTNWGLFSARPQAARIPLIPSPA